MMEPLVRAPAAAVDLLVRGAHVLDPRTGLDGLHDVLVREGEIAQIGAPGSLDAPPGAEVVDGTGRHLFPAFVDPHVHLRVPGQEHKEDLETGTRAAAAGGYCAVVAMPNTDPVVDSTPGLRSLRDAAARDARGDRCRDWLQRTLKATASLVGAVADLVIFTSTDAWGWPSRASQRIVLRNGVPIPSMLERQFP